MRLFNIEECETVTIVTVAVSDTDFFRVLQAGYRLGWRTPVSGRGHIEFEVPGAYDVSDIEHDLEQALNQALK